MRWFTCIVVVAPAIMMLICNSESKPQLPGLPSDDDAFINLLKAAPGNGGQCRCLPIDKCCDPRPKNCSSNILNCADDRLFIDVGVHEISPCPDLLTVCCDTECQQEPTSTTQNPVKLQPTQCGIRNSNGVRVTIAGFKESQAQLGEFPWMVAVVTEDNVYVGGGSLVHPRVVLTAAHKVHDLPFSLIARIGDWNLADTAAAELIPSQNINVEKVLLHSKFDRGSLVNDVALLILQSDAHLSDTVMPICLPQPGQVFDGSDCIVTGWGKDVLGENGKYQSIMKKVSVPAVSLSECQRLLRICCNTRLGSDFTLHSTFNCAGGQGEDACEGDGGSPLVCPNPNNPNEYVQMGVVAWGIGCGIVGNPGVYGSIPQTVDWITQTIKREFGTGVGTGFDERITL